MNDIFLICLLSALGLMLFLFFLLIGLSRFQEKKTYNYGICRKCGGEWKSNASYSSGHELKCNSCGSLMVLDHYDDGYGKIKPGSHLVRLRQLKLKILYDKISKNKV